MTAFYTVKSEILSVPRIGMQHLEDKAPRTTLSEGEKTQLSQIRTHSMAFARLVERSMLAGDKHPVFAAAKADPAAYQTYRLAAKF